MRLFEFGPFQLDAARLLVLERGEPIPLGPKVVETLLALIEHPGEVFPKGELLARIWPEGYVDEANLAQNIYVLRKTLRQSWNVEAIETIPRRGYRFIAPVRERDSVARAEPAPIAAMPLPLPRRGAVLAAAFAVALLGGSAVTTGTTQPPATASSSSTEATRLYAIGRYYWNLRTRDGIAKSVEYFSRVVAADPQDARGYAGLASANAIMADYRYGAAPAKVYVARARSYAREALALDPNSGEAYAVLGLIASETMKSAAAQNDLALADLRHAIALDPASGTAHTWYGMALLEQGRVGDAYAELAKAAQYDPLSVATTAWLGTTAYLERHYRDAISYARETLDLSPQRYDAYETLGLAYEALGDRPRAALTFHRLAKVCNHCSAQAAALLAGLYARGNQMAQARSELAVAEAHAGEVAPQDLAVAFEAVGQRGAALAWLRKWRSDSDYAAAEIANDPRFDGLRRTAGSRQQKPA
jgi:DNA-binding winged helix-turn-helix (wHTH) protein/tetratricopeptide (TPR) repeat protein